MPHLMSSYTVNRGNELIFSPFSGSKAQEAINEATVRHEAGGQTHLGSVFRLTPFLGCFKEINNNVYNIGL